MPLDEWQEQVLEAAMGERADGRWASKFVGVSAPRQNGKSQIIVARALAGVLLFGEKTVIISAHETDTAREIWKRMIDVVEANPTVEARVTGRMDAINREYLSFGHGTGKQTIRLKARRSSGVRGFSADCLLLDEAQILAKAAWGSIVPTMSAMPNPQLWLFGTPPTEDGDPFAFTRVRESATAKKARHCWLEWAAAPEDDINDPQTWANANPAYGVRISYEACADDRAAMDDDQFRAERLGQWDAATIHVPVFGPGAWEAVPKVDRPADLAPGALGVAVSVDLRYMAIAAAATTEDGGTLLRVVAHGPTEADGRLLDALAAVQAAHGCPVVIDGKGPGADYVAPIRALVGDALHVASLDELKDGCAGIFKAVRDGAVVHACDAPEKDGTPRTDVLDLAVAAATKRDVGDRWLWGRRKSGDISPLEAATLAAWGLTIETEPEFVSAYEERGLEVV